MKYCTKCGQQLNDDDIFCPKCGSRQLSISASQEQRETPTRPSQQPVPEEKPARRAVDMNPKETYILLIGYGILFIVYVILCATILNNEGAFLGKLGFLFGTIGFTAISIIRLVKSINRKDQYMIVLHIAFVALMVFFLVGNFIILANS